MNRLILSLISIVFIIASCSKETITEPKDGSIYGVVKQLNENGLGLFDPQGPSHDPSEIFLKDDQGNLIRTIATEAARTQEFSFDSLEYGTYFVYADAPSFKSCQIQQVTIDEQDKDKEAVFWLKLIDFSSLLTTFEVDSLVGDRLWHKVNVAQNNDDRLTIRLYLSDQSDVSNQNYLETKTITYIRNSQVDLATRITPEIYSDSIYIRAHLENPDADECLGDNNLIYHFPQSRGFISVGIKK